MTLFEKYGGFATISKIVISYYDKILDSDQIGDYFVDVDMGRLVEHQTKFVASLMGGPASFSDETLKHVHERFGINRSDFDEAARLMRETLVEFGVSEDDIRTILEAVEARSPMIISS